MSEEERQNEANAPAPEVLEVQRDSSDSEPEAPKADGEDKKHATPATPARSRVAYRPSHKATFVGLGIVAAILAVNVVIITLVMKNQADAEEATAKNGVTISSSVLDKLGVSRNPVGNAETLLVVGPNSTFNGKVKMGSDVSIAGNLTLNSKFNTTDASITNLQAGNTQVQDLNINGDGTVTNINVRQDLQVAGVTRLQGQLTVNQLTTINNNLNVAGNIAVGGSLSVRNFQVSTLTVTGHLLSSGSAPGVSSGGGAGSNGTVSISGNDTSGTVAVNTGVGAGNGLLAQVTFRERYGNTPHVVVTPVGRSVPGLYINRTSTGFSISVEGGLAPGGFAFDYIIVQ